MSRKVETYIEAFRAVQALEVAIQQEGETPDRLVALRTARIEMKGAYGVMTGSQIGEARRRLLGIATP